jgi:hypothetical protein
MAWKRRWKKKKAEADEASGSTTSTSSTVKAPKKPRDPAKKKARGGAKKARLPHAVTPEELLPDFEEILRISLPGRPITKKTSQEIIYKNGRPLIIQKGNYTKYEKECGKPMLAAWSDLGHRPMDFGVGIRMRIYLENYVGVGDQNGYMQSLGDILQEHDIIADDKWIQWLEIENDDHWFAIDKEGGARAELVIVRRRHPSENLRASKKTEEEEKAVRKAAREAKQKIKEAQVGRAA